MQNTFQKVAGKGPFRALVMLGTISFSAIAAHAEGSPKLFSDRVDVQALETIPIYAVGPIDEAAVQAEDLVDEQNGMPRRIAVPFPVSITPQLDGEWETLPNGDRLWRLRIEATDARHVNLGLSQFDIPNGASLVFFAEDRSEIIRAFTAADVRDHGQLWTPIIRYDTVVIELRIPKGVDENDATIEISQIGYGYRGFGTDPVVLASPRSGSCNVDVACPEGTAWADEIPSVGVYTLSGFWTCTGVMVNNTAQDQTPYFLTADHCGINGSNDASIVVYWNYENSTCRTPGSGASGGAGNGSLSQFTTGSDFRADYSPSDFTLVELSSSPNAGWGVTFSGWSRSTGNASSVVAIHHPSTDEKRISFENNPVTTTSYFGTSTPGDGTHIRVADWDLGTTEGGSSGSPIYNPSHQIVGQLHGGLAACGNNESDWYGRFSVSWAGGGSNSTRLSNWLDPVGSNPTSLNTLVPGQGGVCGDGNIDAGETCDDGNTNSGDGCDSNCQIEPSAGDECNSCITIGNQTLTGTTLDNTGAVNDSSCGGTGDTIDEWYCYTATCTGTATASTCNPGTDFDTTLAVYASCGGAELSCNDDATGSPAACSLGGLNRKSIATWATTAGVTYYIRVSGFGGATGNYELTVSCTGTGGGCTNDTIGGATVIGSLPFNGAGDTTGCADNYNEVCPFTPTGAPDVVYSYSPIANTTINIDMCPSGYDTKVYLYQNAVTPGSPYACNDDGCPGSAPASYRSSLSGIALAGGNTYYIVVDGYDSASFGPFSLSITGTTSGPVNDLCANALPIADGVTNFDTTGGTTDGPDEPGACNFFSYTQVGSDIWYRYTASCTGDVSVSLCGSGYDTKIAIYGANCPVGESAIACNDDACGGTTRSELTFAATGGAEYLLRVGGYNATTGTGTITIGCQSTVECTGPGDCDDLDPCTLDECIGNMCFNTLIDSDFDGEPDCSDGCPNDPNKLTPGVCGCGEPEQAADGDMNDDGVVDGRDVDGMVDGLVNGTNIYYNCHGDFNANGMLDLGDIPGLVATLTAP